MLYEDENVLFNKEKVNSLYHHCISEAFFIIAIEDAGKSDQL